ncbi:MAG TPA: DUF4097 family beta strand repeat-containing protein, partial [Verrucomicrobiae bacterium]|nr:DUF4097 family beta strand repeat-containing protein [Verrucomicrobiae bacterium]
MTQSRVPRRCERAAVTRVVAVPVALVFAVALSGFAAAQTQPETNRKEARLDIAQGGSINIINNDGSVTLKAGSGRQVLVAYTLHSNKVEVDQDSTPDKRRIEIRSHALPQQIPNLDEAKVDLEVTVPAGTAITVSTSTAPINADGLNGDITLSSNTGKITVSDVSRSHLNIRSVAAPVELSHVSLGYVQVTSSGGAVQMTDVTGPKVNAATGSGNITYRGDCSGVGDYLMTTHSGNIDMSLPETASVDLNAHSASGSVENDFPLQAKKHPVFVPKSGSSFAGTSNSGSSSVE